MNNHREGIILSAHFANSAIGGNRFNMSAQHSIQGLMHFASVDPMTGFNPLTNKPIRASQMSNSSRGKNVCGDCLRFKRGFDDYHLIGEVGLKCAGCDRWS